MANTPLPPAGPVPWSWASALVRYPKTMQAYFVCHCLCSCFHHVLQEKEKLGAEKQEAVKVAKTDVSDLERRAKQEAEAAKWVFL